MAEDLDKKRARQRRWIAEKRARLRDEEPEARTVTRTTTLYRPGPEGEQVLQWVREDPHREGLREAWEAFADELGQRVERLEPIWDFGPLDSEILVAYPVPDLHLGALTWHEESDDDYDLEIGEELVCSAMDRLTASIPEADTALVAFLGDFLHYDNFEAETRKSRNILDSDTRLPMLARTGARVARYVVDSALRRHQRVHVIPEHGNHDPVAVVFMALLLATAYENEPRVTVDLSPQHYHYFRFGKILLGTHHGHEAKMQNLPLIMATDRPNDWGETLHRHWYTGHIHTSKTQAAISAQDFSGCTVESFRILAPADAWAHGQGYRPHRDMQAIVYHAEDGEFERHKVTPRMLT